MKLRTLRIENFRAIEDQEIHFDNYTCIVGTNGAGKSTILNALNLFFRPSSSLVNQSNIVKEDFFKGDTSKPIRITLTFTDLSPDAQNDLSDYYRQGELTVMIEGNYNEGNAGVSFEQFGYRKIMKEFKLFFEKSKAGAKVEELKLVYSDIRKLITALPDESAKGKMESALRNYEEAHPDNTELEKSTDQFYGVSKGVNRLANHIQWIYIPAVKDASFEQDESKTSALGELLARSIRKKIDFKSKLSELKEKIVSDFERILDERKDDLKQLSESVESKLKDWSHPDALLNLDWAYDSNKSIALSEPFATIKVGEGSYMGRVAQMGHGFQRSLIVALLQELAESPDPSNIPTLILGFEEPELYQHPPQAKYMQKLLEKMSSDRTQVILTTHSPYFAPPRTYNNIRRLKKDSKERSIVHFAKIETVSQLISDAMKDAASNESSMLAKLEQIMQPSQSELYFCKVPIVVEGVEDVAYLASYMECEGLLDEFRKSGCHFIIGGGKSQMSRPLAVSNALSYPAFLVFDSDHYPDKLSDSNVTNNSCLLRLQNCSEENIPALIAATEPVIQDNFIIWTPNIGECVKKELGTQWEEAKAEARQEHFLHDGIRDKDCVLIASAIEKLNAKGIKSIYLSRAVKRIIEHSQNAN